MKTGWYFSVWLAPLKNKDEHELISDRASARCRCGKVELETVDGSILRGICYCASCREAGRRHQSETGADTALAEDGGTDYVLIAKTGCVVSGAEIFWRSGG
jgi:hypothetical protein